MNEDALEEIIRECDDSVSTRLLTSTSIVQNRRKVFAAYAAMVDFVNALLYYLLPLSSLTSYLASSYDSKTKPAISVFERRISNRFA